MPAANGDELDKTTRFVDGWQVAWSRIDSWVDGFFGLLPNLIVGAVVFAILLLVAQLTSSTLRSSFRRRERHDLGEMVSSSSFWVITLFGTLIALTIILPTLNPGDLVASLGIGSIAVGFAFKDILQNWLAGLLILLRQPFRRGDQIRVGEIEGTVHRINQRATLIRTYDNRIVVVPNADIYTSSVIVMTAYPTRRLTLDVTVGYDYEVTLVRNLIANALASLDEVEKSPAPQVLCWELGPTSLALRIRWWTRSQRSDEVAGRSRVVQAIKETFQANGIDPTDPQIVLTQHLKMDEAPSASASPTALFPPRSERPAPNPVSRATPPERLVIPPDDPEAEKPREQHCQTPIESKPETRARSGAAVASRD